MCIIFSWIQYVIPKNDFNFMKIYIYFCSISRALRKPWTKMLSLRLLSWETSLGPGLEQLLTGHQWFATIRTLKSSPKSKNQNGRDFTECFMLNFLGAKEEKEPGLISPTCSSSKDLRPFKNCRIRQLVVNRRQLFVQNMATQKLFGYRQSMNVLVL